MITVRASALDRVMNCLGSVALADAVKVEYVQSDYAREGDAAHWVAQRFAEESMDPAKVPATAPNGVPITAEMIEHAQAYASRIPKLESGPDMLWVEGRVDWQALPNVKIGCRVDASWIDDGALHVRDYKFGWRVVEPDNNWQLIAGAMGVMRVLAKETTERLPQRIILSIDQPRPYHPAGTLRSWEISFDELVTLYQQIIRQLERLPSDALATGDHCGTCGAGEAGVCPAFLRATHNAIDVAMTGGAIDVPLPVVARELATLDRAAAILKQRQEWLEAQAVAALKSDPQSLPGYALETQYGHTTWTIDAAALKQLTNADVEQPAKLITPAEAKRRGVSEEVIKANTKRPVTGQKLVRRDPDAFVRKKLKTAKPS